MGVAMNDEARDPETAAPTAVPLRDYARFWLERTAVRIWRPRFLQHQYERVAEIEQARPGFAAALRLLALEHLGAADPDRAWQAVAALAVVGEASDVAPLKRLADGRSSITSRRFEQNIPFCSHEPQLLGDNKAVLLVANDERRSKLDIGEPFHAAEGSLQQRVFTDKRQELFRIFLA